MPSPQPRRRWLYPMLAILAGVALVYFELVHFPGEGGEKWFWLLVGALLVLFGAADLLARRPPPRL